MEKLKEFANFIQKKAKDFVQEMPERMRQVRRNAPGAAKQAVHGVPGVVKQLLRNMPQYAMGIVRRLWEIRPTRRSVLQFVRRNKRQCIFGGALVIMTLIAFCFMSGGQDISVASTPGVISSSNGTMVYEGAGEQYNVLKYDKEQVWLPTDTKISVLTVYENWYRISFSYQGEILKGYVDSAAVTVNEVNVASEVPATIIQKNTIVYEKAGENSVRLQNEDTQIQLANGKNVVIFSEEMADGDKWFGISFTYNKKVMQGYINSRYARIRISEPIKAAVRSAEWVTLRQEPGLRSYPVLVDDIHAVRIYDTRNVSVVDEELAGGQIWYKILVEYDGVEYRGYVPAVKIRFGEIVEKVPEFTAAPSATPIGRLVATPEPEPAALPQGKKGKGGKGEKQTPAPGAMSMKKFKKYIKDQGFPEDYQKALIALHKQYPYWIFNAYDTGLEWSDAVAGESKMGLNLIENSRPSGYKSKAAGAYDSATDTYRAFDGSSWVAVSTGAVAYFMDPRNFLNATDIFMFESQEYQEGAQTRAGVEEALYNTPMYKTKFTYKDDDGKEKSMYYSQAFMKAARQSGVNPYTLVARVKQEVVTGPSSMSVAVTGNAGGYKGIYNFYNIGATHGANAVYNGLRYAANTGDYGRPWNNPLKAIVGGAQFIGSTYINRGQNTNYLQKFNVTPGGNYNHQYMANIEAPYSEAKRSATAYGNTKATMNLVFSIPIYKNMPKKVCSAPASGRNGNNYLNGLAVQGYAMSPTFVRGADGSTTYKVTVENKVKAVRIQATPVNNKARLCGTGKQTLAVGDNTFIVRVTAENGAVRNYRICVTRLAKGETIDKTGAKDEEHSSAGKPKNTSKPAATAKPTNVPRATVKPIRKPIPTTKPDNTKEPQDGQNDDNG